MKGRVIAPRIDDESLTRSHVVLCKLETELRAAGRTDEADVLGYVDLLVLTLRNQLNRTTLGPKRTQNETPGP